MTERLFVYGTLGPGGEAWSELEPWVTGEPVADAVAGRLYDTGRGYPAATFHPTGNGDAVLVHGAVVDLDPARATEAFATLDRYEGREYERVVVLTAAGRRVHAYAWVAALGGCSPITGGNWNARP